jgi:hypothetical protein
LVLLDAMDKRVEQPSMLRACRSQTPGTC